MNPALLTILNSPLFGVLTTIAVFYLSLCINKKFNGSPLLHPVMLSMVIIITFLSWTEIPYETYFNGASIIHFLLGPATVALAVPLYENFAKVRKAFFPLLVACILGSLIAAGSAAIMVWALGADMKTILSIMPKSVTTPIAMGISEKIGGIQSLTAGMVLITGTIGCIVAPVIFRVLKIEDDGAKGFSLGLSSHGFGTAQAFQVSAVAGAFAGLGLGVTGVFTAFALPLILSLLS